MHMDTAMAFFSKPAVKKPQQSNPDLRSLSGSGDNGRPGASARELASRITSKGDRQAVAPTSQDKGSSTSNVAQWKPSQPTVEVVQANPDLCAVLENAALRYASGHALEARTVLEEGVERDPEARLSTLAWLALFDLLQRAGDKSAFDRLALQYVVQFESSAPAWERRANAQAAPRAMVGGYLAVTGPLTEASAKQLEGLKRAIDRQAQAARLDLATITGFNDAGATLLAKALAEARRSGLQLQLLRGAKLEAGLEAALKKGRAAGEGAWQLSLELLQWANDAVAFEDRAVDFAVTFELSPPSWEPPATSVAPPDEAAPAPIPASRRESAGDPDLLKWSGVMTGSVALQLGRLADSAHGKALVPVDMSEVERIDFVCAGALLNTITRIESQRKTVQIIGASPIIRALLLLLGVAPRNFVKKSQ